MSPLCKGEKEAQQCIPARSELEILAKTSVDISEEATWLLEGQQMKESPLVVARALVIPRNNTVVVRLLNPDAKHIQLDNQYEEFPLPKEARLPNC